MTGFQRIKNIVFGVVMLLFAIAILFVPKDAYYVITIVIGIALIIYGLGLIWFYFSMARLMVGGVSILVKAVLMLDFGVFTYMIANTDSIVVMLYLIGLFAFTGAVDILRGLEIKKYDGIGWKSRLVIGGIVVIFSLILLILVMIKGYTVYMIYSYAIGLVYSAAVKIISAFRRTPMVYIQ